MKNLITITASFLFFSLGFAQTTTTKTELKTTAKPTIEKQAVVKKVSVDQNLKIQSPTKKAVLLKTDAPIQSSSSVQPVNLTKESIGGTISTKTVSKEVEKSTAVPTKKIETIAPKEMKKTN